MEIKKTKYKEVCDVGSHASEILDNIREQKGEKKLERVVNKLDELDMSGQDIRIGFVDYCGGDLEAYCTVVLSQDEGLKQFVNEYPNF
jgi:hypothetical protein